MGTLLPVDDPRDNLSKMMRDELRALGKAHGIDLPPDMPHSDMTTDKKPNMVDTLRNAGITGPDMVHRNVGLYTQPARTDLEPYRNKILPKTPPPIVQPRSWDRDQEPAPPIEKMTMGQMRKECKSRGIKMDRRDNMNTLLEKLRGQNPA